MILYVAATLFCAFFGIVFKLITESSFVFHCTVVLTVWWYCGGRLNCELHVITLGYTSVE